MKIEIKNLSKKFKNNTILENVNLKFEEGKIYGFIGRNGTGKSVLMKIMLTYYEPTTGEVLYDGKNIQNTDITQSNTRALIEKPTFLGNLTGFENLKLLASIQNKIGDTEILKSLEDVNLIEEKDKKYSEYSLGMKQKLGIAQVLMEDPKVIIIDEPFNGIEKITVKKIKTLLKKEREKNKIIIISSHIKDDLEELVDEVYEFDNKNVTKIKLKKSLN